MKPKLLDLCCGGGGAGYGYHLAGFEVTGIDVKPQPKYPFNFIQADALEYLANHWQEYDAFHASPPCQAFTSINFVWKREHPNLIPAFRELLVKTGKPYIIENVPGAPLENPVMLCGTMFGLRVIRHRLFETNPVIWFPPATCQHWLRVVKHGRRPDRNKHFASVTGHFSDVEYAKEAMGIDWMGQAELAQAIPPAYTEWLGKQLLNHLRQAA